MPNCLMISIILKIIENTMLNNNFLIQLKQRIDLLKNEIMRHKNLCRIILFNDSVLNFPF
ncbi:hypothetical protein BH20ACI1_BH20ACI1_16120 [soil metagenome]